MDNDIIQAYLWRDIIRLGFSPSSDKERKTWLRLYGESLKDFWGIGEYPPNPNGKSIFTCNLINAELFNISLSYTIADITKFAVTFSEFTIPKNRLWIHDVDAISRYFVFPEQLFLSKYNKRKQAIKKLSTMHIANVLDGLLFHPLAHQHINEKFHETRIGGGISNPFLFLFHLRYQFCPDSTMKNIERERLVELFKTAVNNNSTVTAHDLLQTN